MFRKENVGDFQNNNNNDDDDDSAMFVFSVHCNSSLGCCNAVML